MKVQDSLHGLSAGLSMRQLCMEQQILACDVPECALMPAQGTALWVMACHALCGLAVSDAPDLKMQGLQSSLQSAQEHADGTARFTCLRRVPLGCMQPCAWQQPVGMAWG